MSDDQFRGHLRQGIDGYSRNRPVKASIWESFAAGIELPCGAFDDPEAASSACAARLDGSTGSAAPPATGSSTWPCRPACTRCIVRRSSAMPGLARPERRRRAASDRAGRLVARHRREAVRPRPGERRSELNAAAARVSSTRSRSTASTTTSGKETVQNLLVLPLRQRHLRADLEPALRRPRADHRGRDGRRRGPRRLLRRDRARCATWSRTTCSQLLALVAMEPPIAFDADDRARREGEGAARGAADLARRRCPGRIRGQYVAARSRARRSRLPRGARRRDRTRRPRPTWR